MDHKVKWAAALCIGILGTGVYIDNRPARPVDFNNPSSFRYSNMLRHANNNVAAAQYVLGTFYLYGHPPENIAQNKTKAQEWFKKAADNGHSPAAFEYARLVGTANTTEAETYYRQAMKGGFTASIFALSQLKLHQATPESVKEGLALLYTASNVKDPMAMAYFATLQHEGAGVKQDRVAAVLGMQQAVGRAPTPETKKDWDAKQALWFAQLTQEEQEDLSDRLMMGSGDTSGALGLPAVAGNGALPGADIASLLSNLPVNGVKPVPK